MMPEEWKSLCLRDLGELKYGKSPKDAVKADCGYPIVGTSGIVGYTEEPLFNGPLVMVGRKGTIDKPLFIEEDCWIIDTAYGLFVNESVADLKWLFYFLNNYGLEKLNEATGVPSLNRESLYNVEVPTPPLPEQRKIAAILTSVDDAIAATQRIIDQTERVKRGLMQQLLTRGIGHTSFKQTEIAEAGQYIAPTAPWETVKFGDCFDIQGGTQPPRSEFVTEPRDGYIRLLQIRDFDSDEYKVYVPDGKSLKKCSEEDIFIARYGASTGRILRGKSGAYNVALAKVIIPEVFDRDFVYYFLNSPLFQNELKRVSARSAQSGFNKQDLAPIEVPMPNIAVQKEIARILSAFDMKLHCEQSYVLSLQRIKQALMQLLLTGKVRVKVEEEAEAVV